MVVATSKTWSHELVERLAARIPTGYAAAGEPASEPTALAGLGLLAHGATEAAANAARWLAEHQSRSGAVGVTADRPAPSWPTALAMMLWHTIDRDAARPVFRANLRRAIDWSLQDHGEPAPRKPLFGHDSTIVGWSWAADTHSWIEPTAMFVAALKMVGLAQHERTRDGVRLLVDRLLPAGGCNYGNTTVLEQTLLPHVQPTGLAMLALAGEPADDPRIAKSLSYLKREATPALATASLAYALIGLAAHGEAPAHRFDLLQRAYSRECQAGASPYRFALVSIAKTSSALLEFQSPSPNVD